MVKKAVEQVDETAQFNLGVMLATNFGEGLITSSHEQRFKARGWLKKGEKMALKMQPNSLNCFLR